MRLKIVWVLELFSQDSVVVDLAIDSKGQRAIFVEERLGSSICVRSALKANAA